MLTWREIDNIQAAVEYYCRDVEEREQNRIANYYTDAEGEDIWLPRWSDSSQALGLFGTVHSESLGLAFMGCDQGAKPLVHGGGTQRHQPGYDFTFSVPKEVSLAFAAANLDEQQKIMGAVMETNAWMLEQLRELAIVRRGHGGAEKIGAEALAVSVKPEASNRNGEIDLHVHNVVVNMCQGEDGKISTLDFGQMVSRHKTIGVMVHAELAHRMKGLGYEIRSEKDFGVDGYETGEVFHRLNRVSQFAVDDNSTRTTEIEAYMAEHSCSKEEANRATKKGKEETPPEETIERTQQKIQDNAQVYGFADAEQLKGQNHQWLEATDADLLANVLHKTESHFSEWEVRQTLARYRGAELGGDGIKEATAKFFQDNDLIKLQMNDRGEARWASRSFYNQEQRMIANAGTMAQDKGNCVDQETAERAIQEHEKKQRFNLKPEQRTAALGIACEAGGCAVLVGRAGTGKTTSIGAVVRAVEANGGQVYGACTANLAAQKLEEETGVQCSSTVKMLGELERGKMTLGRGDMVMVDEAGMVGTKTISRLQEYCQQSGASLLLMGDPKQINAIEAGGPMRALIESGKIPTFELKDIGRQKQEQDREMVYAAYGDKSGKQLREILEATAKVHLGQDEKSAIRSAAQDYASREHSAPIIAISNREVSEANRTVRQELKDLGKLPQKGRVCQGTVNGLNGKSRAVPLEVCDGERIAFRLNLRDNQGQEVANGQQGTVRGFVDAQGQEQAQGRYMRVELDDNGGTVNIDTQDKKQGHWNYAYAITAHKAQGQTMDNSILLLTNERPNEDRGLYLVMLSRHRQQANVHATQGGLQGFEKGADGFREKANVQDLLPREAPALDMRQRLEQRWEQGRDQAEAQRLHQHQERMQAQQRQRSRGFSMGM